MMHVHQVNAETTTPGWIYLTFDDGPHPSWTPQVLEVLAAAHAHASFFMVGINIRRWPALSRQAYASGHTLGNHTWSHRHPWRLGVADAIEEVRAGTAALSDATGAPPCVFRPPHGRVRACMEQEAQRAGQRLVLWTRSAIDWGLLGTSRGIHRRLQAVRAGDIVLMHDGPGKHNRPAHMLRALPMLLAEWARRDLRCVALPRRHGQDGGTPLAGRDTRQCPTSPTQPPF